MLHLIEEIFVDKGIQLGAAVGGARRSHAILLSRIGLHMCYSLLSSACRPALPSGADLRRLPYPAERVALSLPCVEGYLSRHAVRLGN